jgi:class 3 adenylate cyclase
LGKLGNYIVGHPVILIQALGWAIASFVLNHFIETRIQKNQRRFLVIGISATAGILLLFQFISLIFYPKTLEFPLVRYLVTLFLTSAGFFGLWEWVNHVENKGLPERITPTPAVVQTILQREEVRRKELSLDETLKMQVELQAYIQKKFVREVTALDIDVAESTKLKEGQAPQAILQSFNAYWKMVDLASLGNGGRLLNRAGDGAIYLFGKPDEAVEAAKEILKELKKFNESGNTLKSPFLIRMGMNTGEIIEDPNKKTGDIFSQVLDISGHLQKMAGAGEILVSENTYKQLSKKGDFASRGISEKTNIPVYGFKGKI